MKHVITVITLTLIGALPAFAGSATYNRPGANLVGHAIKTCQPKITDATNALVMMRLTATDSRGRLIQHELGEARTAMETGHAKECLAHVTNAVGLEQ
jgi:hypothetical protein